MGMFSSLFGGGEAKRAAGVVAAGQKAAEDIVNKQYEATKATYQPYIDAGTGALSSYQGLAAGLPGQFNPILGQMGTTVSSMQPIINKLTSTNLNDYQTSPGYEFRMQQGQKALENAAAARGTLFSGATGKALQEYGQNFGSNEYQNYLANLQNQLTAVNAQLGAQGNYLGSTINAANAEMTPYSNLMTQGANMTTNLGQLGASAAGQRAGFETGAANATAQGMIGRANELNQTGQQWVQIGAMAAGGAAGAGMLGGAGLSGGGLTGAMQGMQLGSQFGGALNTGQAPQYQAAGYAPTQTQGQLAYQPTPTSQQAYIQPMQQTAQYQGTHFANPIYGFGSGGGAF